MARILDPCRALTATEFLPTLRCGALARTALALHGDEVESRSVTRLLHATVIGEELALAWEGGGEDFIRLDRLRRMCPCAVCQGEPDALGRVVQPVPPRNPGSEVLTAVDPVGGYALQLRWGDGHGSGIYSFDYLRRLARGEAQGG